MTIDTDGESEVREAVVVNHVERRETVRGDVVAPKLPREEFGLVMVVGESTSPRSLWSVLPVRRLPLLSFTRNRSRDLPGFLFAQYRATGQWHERPELGKLQLVL